GFIRLNIGWVAIVITDRLLVGRLNGHNIYKLANYRLITLTKSNKLHLSAQHVHDDNKYFSLIEDTLSWNSLYFSTTFDLTQSLQRQQAQVAAAQEHGEPLSPFWQRTDTRFFWNAPLAQRLMDAVQSGLVAESGLDEYILPVMCGFVDISQMTMNHTPVTFALISRRSRFRPGTRYNSRGIDEQGHVSNFVETEQIIQSSAKQLQASYVQVRGSIPLFWAQVVCVKYVPRLSLQDPHSAMTADAIRRHFDSLCAIYGRVVAVNLTNLVGYEAPMAKGFRDAIAPLVGAAVRHEDFDFHQECKKMRYDRVSVLVSLLGDELEKQSPSPPPAVFTSQTSVLRVNCMDC
ncbi:Synaptojanin, partial [Caulochytrium protostelioides]